MKKQNKNTKKPLYYAVIWSRTRLTRKYFFNLSRSEMEKLAKELRVESKIKVENYRPYVEIKGFGFDPLSGIDESGYIPVCVYEN